MLGLQGLEKGAMNLVYVKVSTEQTKSPNLGSLSQNPMLSTRNAYKESASIYERPIPVGFRFRVWGTPLTPLTPVYFLTSDLSFFDPETLNPKMPASVSASRFNLRLTAASKVHLPAV